MSFKAKEESRTRHKESRQTENVLVLQGGGSLGAFACGVFKGLVKKDIRIDIVCWHIHGSCKCGHNCWK